MAVMRRTIGIAVKGCAALAMLGSGLVLANPSGATTAPFNDPSAIVASHGNLWVANKGASDVVEVAPSNLTTPLQVETASIQDPVAEVTDGTFLFVANTNSITEINMTTGLLVRTIRGPQFDFGSPSALVVNGADLFVADASANAVTVIKASTGALVKVLAGTTAHPMFADPVALADAGSTVWVADESKNAVSEITTTPVLKVTRALSGPTFGFHGPDGLAYADGYLWVANGDTAYNTVTKFQAPSGDSPQIITNSDGNYGFWNPGPMTSSGGMVYVASPPGGSPMVTQIQASTDNGNWMECNTNDPSPDFQDPSSIAVLGPDVFVTNATGNSISPLLVTTGQFLNEVG